MRRMLLLILLISTNVGYAASAPSSLDAKIAALRDMPPSKSLTLVLGSTPEEVATSNRRALLSNVDVYTLGVRSYFLNADETRASVRVSGKGPGESRWLEVDFNDYGQMEKLAANLKGRFNVICFDLHVLKFFKNWENLRFLKELLQDDGVLYVPDPSGSQQPIPVTAAEMESNFTSAGFKFRMIQDDAVKIPLIKDIFQRYFATPAPIQVLVAVKRDELFPNFIRQKGEAYPESEIIAPPYTELSAPKVVVVKGEGHSSYQSVLSVFPVRTCESALGERPVKKRYFVTIKPDSCMSKEHPLRMYILDGIFYGRDDIINKILAAESTFLEEGFDRRTHITNIDLNLSNEIRVGVKNTKGTPWGGAAEGSGSTASG